MLNNLTIHQSIELMQIGSKKYIAIYLKEPFIPFFKINGNDIQHNPILLEEPNKNDHNDIQKLTICLHKLLEAAQNNEYVNAIIEDLVTPSVAPKKQDIDAEDEDIELEEKPREATKEETESEAIKTIIRGIIKFSTIYEKDGEDFFTIITKFRNFLNKKIGYEYQENAGTRFHNMPMMLSLDSYDLFFRGMSPMQFQALTDELIMIYVSFFLEFFPSTKLRDQVHLVLQYKGLLPNSKI